MLLIIFFLTSCGFKPKFKDGSYVKHTQSGCMGTVMMTYTTEPHVGMVIVEDYICEIENKDFKYTKKSTFDIHEDNLKYVGFESAKKYNQALFTFILKDEKSIQEK